MDEIRTILVVPVESPPLEVIPDLIETRFPVYNQYQYQSMPYYVFLEKKIYKNPGGILIAGLVSEDDSVPVADTSPDIGLNGKIRQPGACSIAFGELDTNLHIGTGSGLAIEWGQGQSSTEQALLSPSHCKWRSQRQSR